MENLKKIAAQEYLKSVPSDVLDYLFEQKFKGSYLPIITNLSRMFMILYGSCYIWRKIFNDFMLEFPFLVSKIGPYSDCSGSENYYDDREVKRSGIQFWHDGDIYFLGKNDEIYKFSVQNKDIDITTHQRMIRFIKERTNVNIDAAIGLKKYE